MSRDHAIMGGGIYVPNLEGVSAPSTPSGSSALGITSSKIRVTIAWTDGADYFEVHRSLTQAGVFVRVKDNLRALIYNDTGLAANTTYWYKVRAVSTLAGSSSLSTAFSGVTLQNSENNTVRMNILSAVDFGLTQITTANGYFKTIRDTGRPPKTPEQFRNFPGVNIDTGVEENLNKGRGDSGSGNQAKLINKFILVFDCFLSDKNNPDDAQERMIADLQKYFGNFYYIPDSSGNHTAFNCLYRGHEKWGLKVNVGANVGVTVEFTVWYRQLLTDPTALV